MKRHIIYGLIILMIILTAGLKAVGYNINAEQKESPDSLRAGEKQDDWILDFNLPLSEDYNEQPQLKSSGQSRGTLMELNTIGKTSMSTPSMDMNENLGFSVGGAKDIDNFRLNIEEGFLPLPSSITYEGLFYDYYFDTQGITSEKKGLFSPSYNFIRQHNPITDEDESWLSVGLESNLKKSDFERKKLNLVVVLDISGSMISEFNEYYYDRYNRKKQLTDEVVDHRSKLEIAKETICSMLDHLNEDDRFGMVLFESSAFLAKPLNEVGKTDMGKIKEHIMELQSKGGTNMYAGMQEGTRLFDKYLDVDKNEYENRIIFLTDAMPNRELTDKNSLWGVMDENADNGIYATIIGIGIDFQTRLVEHISKVEGANYYSIHSAKEFKQRLDDEFEYMVTPLVFNLNLVIDADGYEIKRVCGTPYSDESNGEIMKIGTLFPSPTEEGKVKGGIILVELKQIKEDGHIYLLAGYDNRSGEHFQNRVAVDFRKLLLSSYISRSLQKGVLLVHYADLLKEWSEYVRDPESGEKKQQGIDDWQYKMSTQRRNPQLNEWEQRSVPLSVNESYRKKFEIYKDILQKEAPRFEDDTLLQEVDLLDFLINFDETKFPYGKSNQDHLYGNTPDTLIYYDDPPRKINESPIQYPKFAKDAGIQGVVILKLEILTDGTVGAVKVIKSVLPGPEGLDEAAIQYAHGLQFEPAKTNGKPVAVWITFPVNFCLD